jgi:hypothetical protein
VTVLVFWAAIASSLQVPSTTADIESPGLNLMLQRLEEAQHQDPAQSRPYEVIREYKVFRGNEQQPTSDVMARRSISCLLPRRPTRLPEHRGTHREKKWFARF